MASLSPLDGHQRWSLGEQVYSILSEYPAILDIATSLSLNKLFEINEYENVPAPDLGTTWRIGPSRQCDDTGMV